MTRPLTLWLLLLVVLYGLATCALGFPPVTP